MCPGMLEHVGESTFFDVDVGRSPVGSNGIRSHLLPLVPYTARPALMSKLRFKSTRIFPGTPLVLESSIKALPLVEQVRLVDGGSDRCAAGVLLSAEIRWRAARFHLPSPRRVNSLLNWVRPQHGWWMDNLPEGIASEWPGPSQRDAVFTPSNTR